MDGCRPCRHGRRAAVTTARLVAPGFGRRTPSVLLTLQLVHQRGPIERRDGCLVPTNSELPIWIGGERLRQ